MFSRIRPEIFSGDSAAGQRHWQARPVTVRLRRDAVPEGSGAPGAVGDRRARAPTTRSGPRRRQRSPPAPSWRCVGTPLNAVLPSSASRRPCGPSLSATSTASPSESVAGPRTGAGSGSVHPRVAASRIAGDRDRERRPDQHRTRPIYSGGGVVARTKPPCTREPRCTRGRSSSAGTASPRRRPRGRPGRCSARSWMRRRARRPCRRRRGSNFGPGGYRRCLRHYYAVQAW